MKNESEMTNVGFMAWLNVALTAIQAAVASGSRDVETDVGYADKKKGEWRHVTLSVLTDKVTQDVVDLTKAICAACGLQTLIRKSNGHIASIKPEQCMAKLTQVAQHIAKGIKVEGKQFSDIESMALATVEAEESSDFFGLGTVATTTSQVAQTVVSAASGFVNHSAQKCEEMLQGLIVGSTVAYNAITSVTIHTRKGDGSIKPFVVDATNFGKWPSVLARANDAIGQAMLEAVGAHKWGNQTGSIFQPNNPAKKLSQDDRRTLRSMALQLFITTGGCGVAYNGGTPEGAVGDNLLSSNEMVKVLRQNIEENTNWPVRGNYLEMSNGHPKFTQPRDTMQTQSIEIDTAELSQWHFN